MTRVLYEVTLRVTFKHKYTNARTADTRAHLTVSIKQIQASMVAQLVLELNYFYQTSGVPVMPLLYVILKPKYG